MQKKPDKQLRKKGFRIGVYRTKQNSVEDNREYRIQRDIYQIGKLQLQFSLKDQRDIRIFAYEVPIFTGAKRVECIDLLGYDFKRNLYIIEMKRADNREKLSKVIEQINQYHGVVKEIKEHIAKETREAFLLDDSFIFNNVYKMILAPRKYYNSAENKETIKLHTNANEMPLFWYLGNIPDGNEQKLLENNKGKGFIRISINKK